MAAVVEALQAEALVLADFFRKGRVRERDFSHSGWSLRTVKAPVLSAPEKYAWKRELQLFQTQNLPEATFGHNCVEFRHDASGVRLSFCALEALRGWLATGTEPLRVPQANMGSWRHMDPFIDWDWTFTTSYAGCTAVANIAEGVPAKPDSSSIFARTELNVVASTGDGDEVRKGAMLAAATLGCGHRCANVGVSHVLYGPLLVGQQAHGE